jgi:hypothetical protein
MAEHLFCKQVVAGSTPVAGSTFGGDFFPPTRSRNPDAPLFPLPGGVMVAQQILTLLV